MSVLSRHNGNAVLTARVERFNPFQNSALALGSGPSCVRGITFRSSDWQDDRFRVKLYRFMTEAIPLVNSVIWTWSRLAAAPGEFGFYRDGDKVENPAASETLEALFRRVSRLNLGHGGSAAELLHPFFKSLFLDGRVLGTMELEQDLSGVAAFRFFDAAQVRLQVLSGGEVRVTMETESGERHFGGPDVFFYALDADVSNPCGRSILRAVPFVAYVEQQMVDDMRRTAHNAGYHRLHVRITPPERREGESDEVYVGRANDYFDGTVSMIRDIELEDNPVTWDDVSIEYIGPKGREGSRSSNWHLDHRAMVEEICSGTHLAPFLLGYSYNATTNWAQFKYDLVMRQVYSVQGAAVAFLNWLANIELALKGFSVSARWSFDNTVSALLKDQTEIKQIEARCLIDLYNAGLVDKETALRKAARMA